jgi:hypothetical protein
VVTTTNHLQSALHHSSTLPSFFPLPILQPRALPPLLLSTLTNKPNRFAATRSTILTRPLSFYINLRNWLLNTSLDDYISGRILEYSWHIIFGKPYVHCPLASECYCKTFGYCNLTCEVGTCEGRYTLPPFSNLPKGWPAVGWNGEDTGIVAD